MSLAARKCVPCNKGGTPLTREKAQQMLREVPGWEISTDGKWISRKFRFKNFEQALAFVNKVGEVAEAENHHPDIELGWGYANFKLQTHDVDGLHENDFIIASKINRLY